jgi:hypothetical protein
MLALDEVQNDVRAETFLGSSIAEPSFALLIGAFHNAVYVGKQTITCLIILGKLLLACMLRHLFDLVVFLIRIIARSVISFQMLNFIGH